MQDGKTLDHDDIEPLWAIRANAKAYALRWPNIFIFTVSAFWINYAFSGGPGSDLTVLAGICLAFYLFLLLISYQYIGKRCIYVGSRRGISTCYCTYENKNVLAVKHSLESFDYNMIRSVKIFELNSGFAISITQASPISESGLSGLFKKARPGPLSIYDNPYRGLAINLDETGIWKNPSRMARNADMENDGIHKFISKKTKRVGYVPYIFLQDTIFCYKEHVGIVAGGILSSCHCVELQKSRAPIETL